MIYLLWCSFPRLTYRSDTDVHTWQCSKVLELALIIHSYPPNDLQEFELTLAP